MSLQHNAFQHSAFQTALPGVAAADQPHAACQDMPPVSPSRPSSLLTIAQSLILPILASGLVLAFTPARASMPVSFEPPKAKMASMYRPAPTSEFPPFSQHEWVNPQAKYPVAYEVRGLNLSLMGTTGTPFNQNSWQNPALPKPTPAPTSFRPISTPTPENPPFKQTEWANPVRPSAPISEVRGLNLVLLPQAEAARPFTQTDWPNPARPPLTPQGSQPRQGFEIVYKPVSQTDWANPWRPEPFKHDVIGGSVLVLHATPPEDPPFKQTAWVVPPRPIVPPPPSIYRPQAEEAAVVGRPFVQTDWVNPWVPKYATSLFEPQRYALPFTLTPPQEPPFRQTSWPNPIAPPPVRQPQPGQGFEAIYKPVMQNDWPLPWFPPPVKHEVGRNLTLLLANIPAEVRSPARWNWVNPWVPPSTPPLLFEPQHAKLPFWEEGPVVASRLFIDVDTGEIWMRLNATSPYIIKVT